MALNSRRWVMAAAVGCALLTTGLVSSGVPPAEVVVDSPEVLHLRRIQQRALDAAHRFRANARADSVIAALPPLRPHAALAPRIVTDPLLPEEHRLTVVRSVERQWRRLHIDSALVPVTVAVVIDTATAPDGSLNLRRGEFAFDYALATRDGASGSPAQCVVIVAIQMHQVARPRGHRFLAARLGPMHEGSLLGPCGFQARFGIPGPQLDAWLRARSYDLAFTADWEEPERGAGVRSLAEEEGYSPEEIWRMLREQLSPAAQACAAGTLERCEASLVPAAGLRPLVSGSVISRGGARDAHWAGLTRRYLSDLVTAIGPDRFGRFWRSDLAPDDALRAAAAMPVRAWTNRWAMSLVGEARTGPAVALRDVVGGTVLAGLCLAVAAWGFARRQVR